MQSVQSAGRFVFPYKYCELSRETKTAIVATTVAGIVAYKAVKKCKDWQIQKNFRQRVKDRQCYRQKNLENIISKLSVNGVLITKEREEILKLTPEELITKIKEGEYKALDVLKAYQAKAIEATKKVNCVIEFLPEAEEWANAIDRLPLDAQLPLRGLPVSIKEDMAMVGHDTTLGFAKFIGVIHSKDAVIVAGLKRLGAVPFCRTNFVQSLLAYCATNPIFGHTQHPTHPDRVPGGSSGGEAALIALGGSPLGIGDDLGGSVRIPAHFSGIASLKPTAGRIISTGQYPSLPGCQGNCNSPGIMAKNVDSVMLGAEALFSTNILHKIDPRSLPIPWNTEVIESTKPLRIGYYINSNVVPAFPGCKRAVYESIDALRSAGHTVVEIKCPDSFEIVGKIDQLYHVDGGKELLDRWSNDVVDSAMKPMYESLTMPKWYKHTILKWYLQRFAKRSCFLPEAISAHELWVLMDDREKTRTKVIEAWQLLNLDAVIAPGFAYPAVSLEIAASLFTPIIYTMLYNYLDFPAGAVPVTRESAADQIELEKYDTLGDKTLEIAKKAVSGGEGLPIGVQVISYPWQEEVVLRTMKVIQDSLKKPFV